MGDVTKEIAKYISEKQFSITDIEEKLRIPKRKLTINTEDKLTAEEFLLLCAYLKIRPENYYSNVEGIGKENEDALGYKMKKYK